jgi:hypothetical protein
MPDKSVKSVKSTQDRLNQLFKIVRDGKKVRVEVDPKVRTDLMVV